MANESALQRVESPNRTLMVTGDRAALIERGRKDLLNLTSTALYERGEALFSADGVPQDYTQAAFWFRKSADQGNAYAQERLGLMYWMGWGVPTDEIEAAAWYRQAADQGIARAQHKLGFFYLNGIGVPKDAAQAATLDLSAAEQGYWPAQSWLGSVYLKGIGVPSDPQEAYFWSYLADELYAAKNGRGLANGASRTQRKAAAFLTATALAQTQDRVRKWLEEHNAKVSKQRGDD